MAQRSGEEEGCIVPRQLYVRRQLTREELRLARRCWNKVNEKLLGLCDILKTFLERLGLQNEGNLWDIAANLTILQGIPMERFRNPMKLPILHIRRAMTARNIHAHINYPALIQLHSSLSKSITKVVEFLERELISTTHVNNMNIINIDPNVFPFFDAFVTEEIRCSFFEALHTNSLDKLHEMVTKHGAHVLYTLSQSYSEVGETALLLAIQKGHLDLVKFLTEKLKTPQFQTGRFLWEEKEYVDVTPLFAAIVSDQIVIARYLVSLEIPLDSFDIIFLAFSSSVNRSGTIDVLELMGAAYNCLRFNGNGTFGFRCWEEALELREQEPRIPKTPNQLSDLFPQPASEFQSLNVLRAEMDYFQNMARQAFLVSDRILKKLGKEKSNLFRLYAMDLFFQCTSDEYLQSYPLLVDMMQLVESYPWNPKNADQACRFACKLLRRCKHMQFDYLNRTEMIFASYMEAVKFALWYVALVHEHSWLKNRHLEEAETLAFEIICVELLRLSQLDRIEFQNSLSHFIRQGWKSSKLPTKIIHSVCITNSQLFSNFPKCEYIRLLLGAGIDPNCVDVANRDNTPLIILAQGELKSMDIKCIEILLFAGGDIDQENAEGDSALKYLKERKEENFSEIFPIVNCVLPLKCLSAKVIRQNKIPFEKLPPGLKSFVFSHSKPPFSPRFL